MSRFFLLIYLFYTWPYAWAQEDRIILKPGTHRDLVELRCKICHSLDYIPMNGGLFDRKKWESIVDKMITKMGAPVSDSERTQIIEYLVTSYGK